MKVFTLIEILQNETGDKPELMDMDLEIDLAEGKIRMIQFDEEELIWICKHEIDLHGY